MLYLVKRKGCKRCGGDLSLECDIYGVYAECIQCGANWNESEMEIASVAHGDAKPTASPEVAIRRRRCRR